MSTVYLQKAPPLLSFRYFDRKRQDFPSATRHFAQRLFLTCNHSTHKYRNSSVGQGHDPADQVPPSSQGNQKQEWHILQRKSPKSASNCVGVVITTPHLRLSSLPLAFFVSCHNVPVPPKKTSPMHPYAPGMNIYTILAYSVHRNFMNSGTSFSQSASQWPPPTWQRIFTSAPWDPA